MQYGGPRYKHLLDLDKIRFSGVFEVKQFLVLPTGVQICHLGYIIWNFNILTSDS